MKQGTEFVYVKFSCTLFDLMEGEWSPPVRVRLEEDPRTGDILVITQRYEEAGNG